MLKRKTVMFNIPNSGTVNNLQRSLEYCVGRNADYSASVVMALGDDALIARREQFIIVPVSADTHNIAILYEV